MQANVGYQQTTAIRPQDAQQMRTGGCKHGGFLRHVQPGGQHHRSARAKCLSSAIRPATVAGGVQIAASSGTVDKSAARAKTASPPSSRYFGLTAYTGPLKWLLRTLRHTVAPMLAGRCEMPNAAIDTGANNGSRFRMLILGGEGGNNQGRNRWNFLGGTTKPSSQNR